MQSGYLRQDHNKLIQHSFRVIWIFHEGNRVKCICPDTGNVLVDCSKAFFDSEVAKGRILTKPR